MEDSHFEILNFSHDTRGSIFGVFDGHGGSAVSKFFMEHFPRVLRFDCKFENGDIEEGLRMSYLKIDEMMQDPTYFAELKKYVGSGAGSTSMISSYSSSGSGTDFMSPSHPAYTAGCTAVVVYILDNTLYVANSGDSRAVLCRDGDAIDLSTDHKVTLDSEAERIIAAGGVIVNGRVNGSLNLTRAIGDFSFKGDCTLTPERQIITANPDVRTFELIPETDDFIVIACDGLWEVMSSQEVVDYISHGMRGIRGMPSPVNVFSNAVGSSNNLHADLPKSISELVGNLLDLACSDDVGKTEGIGGDNLSCIIVDLRPGKPLSNLERVSKCSEGPFVLKPSKYKALESNRHRGGNTSSRSSSSSSFGAFLDGEEDRIENSVPEELDTCDMVTCNEGLSPCPTVKLENADSDSELLDAK